MKRALISLSDKTNVVEFAKGLLSLGFEIVSTGGTLNFLREAGVEVVAVESITGFPECLGGRVKTLHPLVHGGILGVRDDAIHAEQMRRLGMENIDVVAVNLYPFKATVSAGADFPEVIENIDIGGPSMVRSAAKNHRFVYIVTDADDYPRVLEALGSEDDDAARKLRLEFATKAFEHTANYDAMIAHYFRNTIGEGEPKTLTLTFEKSYELRYGENPHQSAAYYTEPFTAKGIYHQLHGKTMSYNNTADLTAAIEGVSVLQSPACFAVKHAMPCGAAEGVTVLDAYLKAYQCDPLSIFGGIVAFNAPVTKDVAEKMREIFLEVIAAPSFDAEAVEILSGKKNIRLIIFEGGQRRELEYRSFQKARGGILYQDYDDLLGVEDAKCVTRRKPTECELRDLEFAMKVCVSAKSNAIVAARNGATIGIGQGQVSRVFAAEIAVKNAGDLCQREIEGGDDKKPLEGAVIASDAFFPFRDAIAACVDAGATAVIQPGGSVGDEDIIKFADERGIAMIFTGVRHFRHGY